MNRQVSIQRAFTVLCLSFCFVLRADPPNRVQHRILLIVGASGESVYAEGFERAAQVWNDLGAKAGSDIVQIGPLPGNESHAQAIRSWIESLDSKSPVPVWIVYLGHGTYNPIDGAKINLVGEDVSATQMRAWLQALESPLVFVHGGSASAPFIPELTGPGRIIVTATRSGNEQNYARFGEAFADSMAASAADIDRDGQVSVLEAFIMASKTVELFYQEAGRLSTEHALLDDNGDGRGTPADRFHGLRLKDSDSSASESEGQLARQAALVPSTLDNALTPEQLRIRESLEAELQTLRSRKGEMDTDTYYLKLEEIMRRLAIEVYGESIVEADPATPL